MKLKAPALQRLTPVSSRRQMASGQATTTRNYQDRPGNSIYYSTPNFSGFSAAASYSFGENKTATVDAGSIVSANIQYAGGPFAVALSHQQEKATDAQTAAKFTQLNGSWDFRVVKLLAAYGQVKNGSTGLFLASPANVAVNKSQEYQIGVDVPLGSALTVSGGVSRAKLTLATGGDIKSTSVGLAAKYDLSKRTFLYTGLQLAKNEAAVGNAEIKTDTFAVGVQHKF